MVLAFKLCLQVLGMMNRGMKVEHDLVRVYNELCKEKLVVSEEYIKYA